MNCVGLQGYNEYSWNCVLSKLYYINLNVVSAAKALQIRLYICYCTNFSFQRTFHFSMLSIDYDYFCYNVF